MLELRKDLYLQRLIYIFLLLAVVKGLFTLSFKTPWIWPDEVIYASIAKNILFNHIFVSNIQYPQTYLQSYPPGYPLILSISYLFSDKDIIYHIMLFINAVVNSLILFPSYFICKKFIDDKFAFQLSILVAIAPSNLLYTFVLMSENLFIPLFLFSVYFVIEAFTTENKIMEFLAGLSIAYLFITKTIGIAMIISFFIIFIYYVWIERRQGSLDYIKRKHMLLISLFGPLLIWIQYKSTFIRDVGIINGLAGYSVSDYYVQTLISIPNNWNSFILLIELIIHEIGYIMIAVYLIFFIFTIFILFNTEKMKNKEEFNILFLYGMVSTLILLMVTVTHMYLISNKYYLVFGRYIDSILPLFYILGGIGMYTYNNIENKYNPIKLFIIILLFFVVISISFPYSYYKLSNMLSVFYIQDMANSVPVSIFFLILVFVSILYMRIRNISMILIFVFLMSLIAAIHTYQQELTYSSDIENQNQIGRWLQQNDNSSSVVLMAREDYDDSALVSSSGIEEGATTFFFTNFWMNGDLKLSNSFDDIKKREDIRYIISSKPLLYEYVTESPNYILYDAQKMSNFNKEYSRLIDNNYTIDIGRNDNIYIDNFWSSGNDKFRWTKNYSKIKIPYSKDSGIMTLVINTYEDRPSIEPANVRFYMNGYQLNFTKVNNIYIFEISDDILETSYQTLTIETNTWNPSHYGSKDDRDLGIQIGSIKIEKS